MYKSWKGRIEKNTDSSVEDFTDSLSVDSALYYYDIMGNIAYIKCLKRAKIMAEDEAKSAIEGLLSIKEDIEKGKIVLSGYEDIHSLVEGLLIDRSGETAKKIHTGRSRNDQVVLDMRLAAKELAFKYSIALNSLLSSLASKAKECMGLVMPSYTHLQKGQPVLVSHYFMAYAEKFKRDLEAAYLVFENTDSMPLGSGASVGSGYEIDRDHLAALLKFKCTDDNSMDAVSNRDFLLDFIFMLSKSMLHLSRLAEDIIIFVSQEYSYFDIDDAFCTGSSIMPQKKNPDVLELIRGKCALVIGNMVQLMSLLKALPMTYNRDLQEDKGIFLNAYSNGISSVNIMSKIISNLDPIKDSLEGSLKGAFLEATDLADYLVRKGESFRNAHNIIGRLVGFCIKKGKDLKDIDLEVLKGYSERFDKDYYDAIAISSCIDSKKTDCSTNTKEVNKKIKALFDAIKNNEKKIGGLGSRLPSIKEIL